MVRFSLAILSILAAVAACSTTSIYAPLQRPAVIDFSQVRTVGVWPVYAAVEILPSPASFPFQLESALVASLAEAGFTSVFIAEGYRIDPSLSRSHPSSQDLQSAGAALGLDAVLVCEVKKYRYQDEVLSARIMETEGLTVPKNVRLGRFVAEVRVRAIDLQRNAIIWDETLPIQESAETKAVNADPPSIDTLALLDKAALSFTAQVAELAKPQYEMAVVSFFKDGDYPEMSKGIAAAQKGKWAEAVRLFRSVAKRAEGKDGEDRVQYNLGVALQFSKDFRAAVAAFEKAHAIKNSPRYTMAIEQCLSMEKEYAELLEQRIKR